MLCKLTYLVITGDIGCRKEYPHNNLAYSEFINDFILNILKINSKLQIIIIKGNNDVNDYYNMLIGKCTNMLILNENYHLFKTENSGLNCLLTHSPTLEYVNNLKLNLFK